MAERKRSKATEKAGEVAKVPGEDLSTAGFAMAIASIFTNLPTLGLAAVVGLVLSIMGRVQTSKAGRPNTLALAGIIISAVTMFLTFVLFLFFVMLVILSASDYSSVPAEPVCTESGLSVSCEPSDDVPMHEFRRN